MTIEQDISRIRELLEVMTEVVVEKAFAEDTSDDTRCSETCLCDNDNDGEEEFSILSSISVPVQFHSADALIVAAALGESEFTSTADFIRHATLAYIDLSLYPDNNGYESSDNEADIEFVVNDDGDLAYTLNLLNLWLSQQINWSWQNRKNAEANAFELVFDKLQKFLKGER